MKLPALNIVFTSLNFAPLHTRNSPYRVSNLGTPFKILAFTLEWQQPREMIVPSGVYEGIVPNVSWAFKHALQSHLPLCIS